MNEDQGSRTTNQRRGAAAIEDYFEQYMPDMARPELAAEFAAACAAGDTDRIEQLLTDLEEAIWQISLGYVADAAAEQISVARDEITDGWDGEDHRTLVEIILAAARPPAGD